MKTFNFKSIYPDFLCKKIEVTMYSDKDKYLLEIELNPFDIQFDLIDRIIENKTNTIMFKENLGYLLEESRRFI